MDPRISARRIAVRRQEGLRRLRRLTWLAGVVGLALLAGLVTRTPLLDVDAIAVDGAARISTEQLEATLAGAGLHRGDPLLDVDLGDARRALEALPSVTEARLERRWPGTIAVSLVERLPVAAVAGGTGTALVGEDGVVVELATPQDVAAAGVVAVAGPTDLAPGDRYDAPELLSVAAALPEQLRPLVASVTPGDGEGAVELQLAAGGVVRLGAADQLPTKLVAAATVLTQVDTGCLAVLDVRVPSVPAVTRDPGC
jgi:cell division protein FtsQ